MAKFDYMNFEGGSDGTEFAAHAKKYTKQQAVDLFRQEWGLDAIESAIMERTVKYYVSVPYWCGYDGEGGCYTYCAEGERGAFPVWVFLVRACRERNHE